MFLAAFQDLKSAFFCTFSNSEIKKKHSILIIFHYGQFSFSTLFLNFVRYSLLPISAPFDFTPMDVRFFSSFYLFLKKFKAFMKKKKVNIAVVGNVPNNVLFYFSPSLCQFWPFSEAKVKFSGSQMLVKNAKIHVFLHTNQFSILVYP